VKQLLPWIVGCLALSGAPTGPPAEVTDAYVQQQIAAGRQYTIALLRSGDAETPSEAGLAALRAAHLRYLFGLKEAGDALLVGPLMGHPEVRGIIILATEDVEKARELVAADPLVSRGLLRADVSLFFGIPGDALR
jgi:uncharacterized protein YciI